MQQPLLGQYSQFNIPAPYGDINMQALSGGSHCAPYSMAPNYDFMQQGSQQLYSQPPSSQTINKPSMSVSATAESQAHPMLAVNSRSGNYLPSTAISKQQLRSVDQVIQENYKLCTESSAGTLCQILARESFFGKEVMEQCTPNGARDCPGLPRLELNNLKATMFRLFPRFQSCPEQFEPLWKRCMNSIEQACRHLRLAKRHC